MTLPKDILGIIYNFSDVYTKTQISMCSKELYIEYRINDTLENRIAIQEYGKMGEIIKVEELNVEYDKNSHISYSGSGTLKIINANTFNISKTKRLQSGKYMVSAYYWNIYETLMSRISSDLNVILEKKFIPYECLNEVFQSYNHHNRNKSIKEKLDGELKVIGQDKGCYFRRRYEAILGIFEIENETEITIEIYNDVIDYFKDNIEFECFRLKRL